MESSAHVSHTLARASAGPRICRTTLADSADIQATSLIPPCYRQLKMYSCGDIGKIRLYYDEISKTSRLQSSTRHSTSDFHFFFPALTVMYAVFENASQLLIKARTRRRRVQRRAKRATAPHEERGLQLRGKASVWHERKRVQRVRHDVPVRVLGRRTEVRRSLAFAFGRRCTLAIWGGTSSELRWLPRRALRRPALRGLRRWTWHGLGPMHPEILRPAPYRLLQLALHRCLANAAPVVAFSRVSSTSSPELSKWLAYRSPTGRSCTLLFSSRSNF